LLERSRRARGAARTARFGCRPSAFARLRYTPDDSSSRRRQPPRFASSAS